MLSPSASTTSTLFDTQETLGQRRQRLRDQLLAAALPLVERMADALVDSPDHELCRAVEVQLRDLGQQLAATAQQAGLDDRKKGGIRAPALSAPTASTTPASSSNAPTTSSPSMAR